MDGGTKIVLPPNNVEAEQALLAALMVNNAQYERVSDFLRAEHFFEPAHQRIFAAIKERLENGRSANPFLLRREFEKDDILAPHGGVSYLGKLYASCLTTVHLEDFAREVVECAQLRALETLGEEMGGSTKTMPPDALTEVVEQRMRDIADITPKKGPAPIGVALRTALAEIETARKAGGKIIGIPSGLTDLDNMIGGFMPGEFTVLAGRPSMGKTSVAKSIALGAAKAGYPVAFFSLEMPEATIAKWFLADLTGIAADRQRKGDVTDEEIDTLEAAARHLNELCISIDDTAGLSVSQIRSRAARIKRRYGGSPLIIIDHIGHVSASAAARRQNRTAEVTEISQGFMNMAKDLECPVIALSQLNRAVEGRDDKRPGMSDLRDSGSIEQDAHTIIFAYRPEYYLERQRPEAKPGENREKAASKEADWQAAMSQVRGITELIIQKNRSGPIDTVRVLFEPTRSRVVNLARF